MAELEKTFLKNILYCMHVNIGAYRSQRHESTGAVVTGGCEMLGVGAGNQTQVLEERHML